MSSVTKTLLSKGMGKGQGVLLCVFNRPTRHAARSRGAPPPAAHRAPLSHAFRTPRCSKKGYVDGPRLLVNSEEVKAVRACGWFDWGSRCCAAAVVGPKRARPALPAREWARGVAGRIKADAARGATIPPAHAAPPPSPATYPTPPFPPSSLTLLCS